MSPSRPRFEGAGEYLPKTQSLTAMARAVHQCHGCDLWENRTSAVFGEGTAQADLVLVGEQPGDREERDGKPFVGPAGTLLARALEDADIDRDRVYLTNAVKHFRFSQTRGKRRIHQSPQASHVVACRPWLDAELAAIKPTGVVALGATAGKSLIGPSFRVGGVRGSVLDSPSDDYEWLVPTVHPSSVLRSRQREADYAALVADLQVAASALKG
jgi:uracil-DNA glycosylase family protein